MAYAPSLTVSSDGNPSPRVLVTFASLAAGTQTINVYRVAEGRQFQVRGGVNLFAVGGIAVMDYEVPLGTPMTFRAEMFDAAGNSLGFTDASSQTIDPAAAYTGIARGRAWVHQPLKPNLAVQCTVLSGSAATLSREMPGDVYYPEGSTVGVRIGSQRRGLTGAALSFLVDNVSDADEFQSMLGGYTSDFPAILCIRTPPPRRLPRTLFASVSVNEVALASGDRIRFDVTLDEVAPPAPGLVIPILRRADIDAAFTTRSARAAAYATRLARDTDYSKAGLAG